MDFDDPSVQGELSDQDWQTIQRVLLAGLVVIAPQLGSRQVLGSLLRKGLEGNPMYQNLSEAHRFRLWQYTDRLLDQAYRFDDAR